MAVSTKAVANFFIDVAAEEGKSLTPMKVQKLVYFANGWHLAITGEPLIDERIEAWKFGPVIRSLYAELATYGNQAVNKKLLDFVFEKTADGGFRFDHTTPAIDQNSQQGEFIANLLRRVWSVYGGYSAVQLSNLTHALGTPWDQVNKLHSGVLPNKAEIPREMMRDYFVGIAKK